MLERQPSLRQILPRLDRWAHDRPRHADCIVSVWRPRPQREWPIDEYHVRSTNPVYQRLLARERAYWGNTRFAEFFRVRQPVATRMRNRGQTGDPERSWIADLAARGPFRRPRRSAATRSTAKPPGSKLAAASTWTSTISAPTCSPGCAAASDRSPIGSG